MVQKMIPRIGHFHWTGGNPSWLRQAGFDTFRKFHRTDSENPWTIHIHDTPEDIRSMHFPCYGNEADATWWRMLDLHGGWELGSDVIYTKEIPSVWEDSDLSSQINDIGHIWQFAVMGCKPGHPFIKRAHELIPEVAKSMPKTKAENVSGPNYQNIGVDLLLRVRQEMGRADSRGFGKFVRISDKAYHFSQFNETHNLWSTKDVDQWVNRVLDDPEIYGVHWFGGAIDSRPNEVTTKFDGPSRIEKLATRILS